MADQNNREVEAPKETGEDAWEFFYEKRVPEVLEFLFFLSFQPVISRRR
jgi:hypothetical protein